MNRAKVSLKENKKEEKNVNEEEQSKQLKSSPDSLLLEKDGDYYFKMFDTNGKEVMVKCEDIRNMIQKLLGNPGEYEDI